MEQFSSNPASTGISQEMPKWVGQNFGEAAVIDHRSSWSSLRLLSGALKVIAWIELVAGVIISLTIGAYLIAELATMSADTRAFAGSGFPGGYAGFVAYWFAIVISIPAGTVLSFLWTYGAAELILVLLTIEKNTRKK